jgi:hypothetical protein
MALTNFVNQGGNLTIIAPTRNYFGLLEDTFKFHIAEREITLPELSNQTFSIEIAHLGNGTIEYLDSESLFHSLDQLEQNKRARLLACIVPMLNVNGSLATAAMPDVPPNWGQTTELSASGQIELSSDFLKPLKDNIQSEAANFTASQILYYDDVDRTPGPIWNNATINLPDLFNVTSSKVIADELVVRPDGVGQYSIVNLRNGKWIFNVADGSSIPVNIEVEGQQLNVTLVGGIVELGFVTAEFVVAPFSSQVDGVMNLSNAFFAWPPQDLEAAGEDLSVLGSSKIWVTNTDGTLLVPAINVINGSVIHQVSRSIILSCEVFSFLEIGLIIVSFLLVSSFFILLITRRERALYKVRNKVQEAKTRA